MPEALDHDRLRAELVRRDLHASGVRSPRVLAALGRVRRELFVPRALAKYAYEDRPLPIGAGQTISQPSIVAIMLEALDLSPDDRVLEVGTGSGYAAAVLAELASEVYTIEWHRRLAREAAARLAAAGYSRVRVRQGDGTLGWPSAAPFDAILVSAGGPRVPRALLKQLAPGGRLVIPVGPSRELQQLLRVSRDGTGAFAEQELGDVVFVPLAGAEGWS
jgi:protein-L-isoaspartate(D-aspartate) O-methyltransferase